MSVHPDDPSLISFRGSSSKTSFRQHKLKTQVQKLNDENAKLSESLEIRNVEVKSLNDRIAKLTGSINSLTSECSAASSAKVVELSKKNRHLTAELTAVKFKFKSLEQNLRDLENSLAEKDDQLKLNETQSNVESNSQSEVQMLTEKLEKTNKKVFEILNQNTQLKNELKIAQKCLQQEIGENVNIAQLMCGSSNWRGRAQQIAMLQSKIADLKDKLETSSCYDSYDDSRLPLKRLESMRRLEVDSLKKELDDCKIQLEEVKHKLIAFKTRNKNLSDEANNYKLKTLDLLEKSSRDEEFVKCLNEQISLMEHEFDYKTNEMKKEILRVEHSKEEFENEIQKLRCQMQIQQDLINDKNNEITNLKISIEQLENSMRESSGDFLFSCRQMSKDDYTKLLKNLEQEKNDLLGFMQQLNERLDKESVKVSEQHDTINKQRVRISRLESKLKEVEAEKEAAKVKHRRSLRISEYSRNQSNDNIQTVQSNDQTSAEIDKYKIKLEVAMERVEFLEKKIKDQTEEHQEDNQRFMEIIGKSKEIFKNLFDGKDKDDVASIKASECQDTTVESFAEN